MLMILMMMIVQNGRKGAYKVGSSVVTMPGFCVCHNSLSKSQSQQQRYCYCPCRCCSPKNFVGFLIITMRRLGHAGRQNMCNLIKGKRQLIKYPTTTA